ncbi:DUF4376 domain-containing protein (plasmid) [Azospirillum brasilense]|uniref:DUF4376 domain-containing protein n=1 Tax=Azospirillum brasilense TaxID=192 RepID=A0A4D8QUP5_AZOBR|nr:MULTISPECIES: DUF4376 domain-containing protein [Azospirillum]YP_001686892.1 DUF4376 domain-containing protein [Azospirillum phage Cd]MDW7555365.1 DUF4376 domain-containing protein [Azospirillum brasilense]MDW7595227.1 DUF4376 domain-containing protein [Azospirillum brasilense]MDW7630381.1 DUF4376 domain-containing protein [Azospirillum brasilense]MDX5949748.1 DUF4376 domain-containing protein [Azospirillum brasilense]OPH21569.1 hypothetical protein FE88_07780 [Azospirillum brasilense]
MLYAASTGGFYDRAIHGDTVPADAVEITDEEYAALFDGQSLGQRIVPGQDGRPTFYTPTLDDTKADRKAAATARRQTERDRGVVVNGNRWHSDKGSADDIATAVAMARLQEAGQGDGTFRTIWKTADGFVSVTLSDLLAAGLAVGNFVQACFANEAVIYAAIDAAETIEDVNAVSLESGWPDDGGPKDAATIKAIQQANARLERRAKELEAQGDYTGAQLLRLSIKEI